MASHRHISKLNWMFSSQWKLSQRNDLLPCIVNLSVASAAVVSLLQLPFQTNFVLFFYVCQITVVCLLLLYISTRKLELFYHLLWINTVDWDKITASAALLSVEPRDLEPRLREYNLTRLLRVWWIHGQTFLAHIHTRTPLHQLYIHPHLPHSFKLLTKSSCEKTSSCLSLQTLFWSDSLVEKVYLSLVIPTPHLLLSAS